MDRREFLKKAGKLGIAAAAVPVIQYLPKEPVEGKRSVNPPRPRAPHPTPGSHYRKEDIAGWIPLSNSVYLMVGDTLEVEYQGHQLMVGPGVYGEFSEVAISKDLKPVAVR